MTEYSIQRSSQMSATNFPSQSLFGYTELSQLVTVRIMAFLESYIKRLRPGSSSRAGCRAQDVRYHFARADTELPSRAGLHPPDQTQRIGVPSLTNATRPRSENAHSSLDFEEQR